MQPQVIKKFADFLGFLLPDSGPTIKIFLQKMLFIGFPVLVGWFVYSSSIPGAASPVELRIQHPTLPQAFEKLENPFRKTDAETQQKMHRRRKDPLPNLLPSLSWFESGWERAVFKFIPSETD